MNESAPLREPPGARTDEQPPTQSLGQPTVSDSGQAARSASAVRAPAIPGYRIGAELGRGGMGVVFSAEQLDLGRAVALKMILGDAYASDEIRSRFRREAQAVARLQHPNIVQIFEVGDYEGRPYFSLEYVAGGSLARRLGGQPQPPVEAAQLAQTIARAMAYAHEHGIVHRDLKPANVLVSAGGEPKITDFGLAKILDHDLGQTQSGAIIGTPSYMAPEQAEGRSREIGPLADVYALGAILYEMLTGQPPFHGKTPIETIQQVLTREVVPPSRLQPRVPRPLEIICLKALAKEPARRYPGAGELADDLGRWLRGEPILARRESVAAWLSRRVRRNRLSYGLALACLLALMAVGFFVFKDSKSARIERLLGDIQRQLEAGDWAADRVAALDVPVAELERLDPDKAAGARDRIERRLADGIRAAFATQTRPILQAGDVTRIEAELGILDGRSATLAAAVRREFTERLRKPQVHELKPPYANLRTVTSGGLQVEGDTLLVQAAEKPGTPTLVTTSIPCLGKIELEAVFAAWDQTNQLSLHLNEARGAGYRFLLSTPYRTTTGDVAALAVGDSFAAFRARHGVCHLRIFRGGTQLREHALERVETGPLVLRASRDGDRLSFQVNSLQPVLYFDAFPIAAADAGVFAVQAPAGVRLQSLRAFNQALPAAPSPLERGDDFYNRGRFQEALDHYRQQPEAPVDIEAGQELRYKSGACLVRLKRLEEAAPLLEQVALAEGQRWPLMALFQLWLVRVQQNRLDEVDAILLKLSDRRFVEQLATVLPVELRTHVTYAYSVDTLAADFIRFDPLRAAKLERILPLANLFPTEDYQRLNLRGSLLRAYVLERRLDKALELAEELVTDKALMAVEDEVSRALAWQIRVIEEYGWLCRLSEPRSAMLERARTEVDRRLFKKRGLYRDHFRPLLLERARLHTAAGRPTAAEADLDELFRTAPPGGLEYRFVAEAALLRGFLYLDRGDRVAAQKAWQQGLYKNWLPAWRQAHPEAAKLPDRPPLRGTEFVSDLTLAGITGLIDDAEAKHVGEEVVAYGLNDQVLGPFRTLIHLGPRALIELWQSPHGMEAARHIALRDVPWPDYIRYPARIVAAAILIDSCIQGPPAADQRTLVWETTDRLFDAYFLKGTLGNRHLLPLGVTFKGSTGVFGWAGVAPSLAPALRGPLAYLFGQRYLLLRHEPAEALKFFQMAHEDAAREPYPLLQRLSEIELARLRDAGKR